MIIVVIIINFMLLVLSLIALIKVSYTASIEYTKETFSRKIARKITPKSTGSLYTQIYNYLFVLDRNVKVEKFVEYKIKVLQYLYLAVIGIFITVMIGSYNKAFIPDESFMTSGSNIIITKDDYKKITKGIDFDSVKCQTSIISNITKYNISYGKHESSEIVESVLALHTKIDKALDPTNLIVLVGILLIMFFIPEIILIGVSSFLKNKEPEEKRNLQTLIRITYNFTDFYSLLNLLCERSFVFKQNLNLLKDEISKVGTQAIDNGLRNRIVSEDYRELLELLRLIVIGNEEAIEEKFNKLDSSSRVEEEKGLEMHSTKTADRLQILLMIALALLLIGFALPWMKLLNLNGLQLQ